MCDYIWRYYLLVPSLTSNAGHSAAVIWLLLYCWSHNLSVSRKLYHRWFNIFSDHW